MLTRTAALVFLLPALSASAVSAQTIPVTDVLVPNQMNHWIVDGEQLSIPVHGPPNTEYKLYLSKTGNLTDWLTNIQLSQPDRFNFELDGITFSLATTLDADGWGEIRFDPTPGGTNDGSTILPLFGHQTTTAGSAFLMETKTLFIASDSPAPPGPGQGQTTPLAQHLGAGGVYRGPGDRVPPNFYPGPPGGDWNCDLRETGTYRCECWMKPTGLPTCPDPDDDIDCFSPDGAYVLQATRYKQGELAFQCEGEGDVYHVTYGDIQDVLAATANGNTKYLDIVFEPVYDPDTEARKYECSFFYPVELFHPFALEWLWLDDGCNPIQQCGEIEGGFKTLPPDNLGALSCMDDTSCVPFAGYVQPCYLAWNGFHFCCSAMELFDRAVGNGVGHVYDCDCSDSTQLVGQRVRMKIECLRVILAHVQNANPDFFRPSQVMFAIGGAYCPL